MEAYIKWHSFADNAVLQKCFFLWFKFQWSISKTLEWQLVRIGSVCDWTIDQIHISYDAPIPYPIIHFSEQKCAHFSSEWCFVGYETGVFVGSIVKPVPDPVISSTRFSLSAYTIWMNTNLFSYTVHLSLISGFRGLFSYTDNILPI